MHTPPPRSFVPIALVLLAAACSRTNDAAPSSAADGAALFKLQQCAMCHGADGGGQPGAGPALRGLAEHWSAAELAAYLADPASVPAQLARMRERGGVWRMQMPRYAQLDADQRGALARHVLAW